MTDREGLAGGAALVSGGQRVASLVVGGFGSAGNGRNSPLKAPGANRTPGLLAWAGTALATMG